MPDDKGVESIRLNTINSKPTVHYADNVNVDSPSLSYQTRFGTLGEPPDRPPIDRPSSVTGTDDEDEDEDYDWSGEDDLVDEEAKFEQKMGIKTTPKGWFRRIITFLFSSLIGSTFLSGILITPAILIHFYWYKRHPTPQRLIIKQNIQAWLFWAAANLLMSWYLAIMVDIVPVVTQFVISLSWGHVSEYVKSRIEMYKSVKDTVKPLLYAASGWISWILIFGHIYDLYNTSNADMSRASYTPRVAQTIEFFFFFALVVCAQRMLSHVVAFGFHLVTFKERLQSVTETLKVVEKLRQYRPKRVKASGTRTRGLSEKDHFNWVSSALRAVTPDTIRHRDDIEDLDAEEKSKGKEKRKSAPINLNNAATMSSEPPSRPITPPLTMPDAGLNSNGLDEGATLMHTTKPGKAGILAKGKNIIGGGEIYGQLQLGWQVNSAREAKRLARSIYLVFKDRHRTYLLPSDFYPAFATEAEAVAAFRVFDKDNNGDISRAEIKTTLLKVYKERQFLARSMRDVGIALKTLDHILLCLAMVVLFFISLSIFGVNVTSSLSSVYTIGLAASFVFKTAASSAFDAMMFLFVTHPYDTGDRCIIDTEVLVVKKMGLFATVFTRLDGSETHYFNSQLFSQFITNVRRSDKMFENLTMQVAWRTPIGKLDALEKCLNEWLATEENRWFQPNTQIILQRIAFQRYLEITIGIAHNGTWQDWNLRLARKTAFHAAVQFYSNQLDITCYEAPLPVQYLDSDTSTDQSLSPASPEPLSPREPVNSGDDEVTFMAAVKPALGFLPPPDKRSALTRARKSKSKKSMLRSTS